MAGINVHDFRNYIVNPSLTLCQSLANIPNTNYIQNLIVATAAQETMIGTYLHQTGQGKAISIYQFEPTSLNDLMNNFISINRRFDTLIKAVTVSTPPVPAVDEIIWNLRFATVAARLYYYRVREPLPIQTTFDTLWHYYKTYWNTSLGAATEQSFRQSLKLTDIRV